VNTNDIQLYIVTHSSVVFSCRAVGTFKNYLFFILPLKKKGKTKIP